MGRKKRDKKKYTFRLYEETHYALLRLTRNMKFKEIEQTLELLLSTFNAFLTLITASQKNITASQLLNNCQSEKITDRQFSDFCQSVIRSYREVVGREEPPEPLKTLWLNTLMRCEPHSPLGCTTFTPEVNHVHPKYNKGNKIKRNKEYEEILTNVSISCSSAYAEEPEPDTALPATPNTPITRGEKNKEGGATANDLQSQDFGERMEEHRRRLSRVLQEQKLRWSVERLMVVVKEWERVWGRWDEKWDEYLIAVFRYPSIHPNRVASYVRKFEFPENVEPSFAYAVSPVLKQIAKAEAEGKEVAETILGDVKLRRKKRTGLSVREVVEMWNKMAEKEKLLKRTELTPSLKAHIEQVLALHPQKEWWERLFSLVPKAVVQTKDPNSPRDLGWLFYSTKKGGRILDWVLGLDVDIEKKTERRAVFREDLRFLCEKAGVEKRKLVDLLRKKGVKVSKEGSSDKVVMLTGNEKFLGEFVRLLNEKEYDSALAFLLEEVEA